MSTAAHHPHDRTAAFTGLIVGAVALVLLLFGIVKLTNASYASHEKPTAASSK
jgi:hypothetical protein